MNRSCPARCVDLGKGRVRVFQLQRSRFRHGCNKPNACGEKHHREGCATGCNKHKGKCPKPCQPACMLHAQYCPDRTGGEWVFREPNGGKARTVAIPPPLVPLLKAQHTAQRKARLAAGAAWEEWDLVFSRPEGRPIDPSDDWAEWKRLAKAAGVRDSRVHDARHTAATLLLEQG